MTNKEATETLADIHRAIQGQDLLLGSALAREVLALRRERDALLKDIAEKDKACDKSSKMLACSAYATID